MIKDRNILIRNLATLCIVGNLIFWIFPFAPIVWRIGLLILCLYAIWHRQGKFQSCEKVLLVFVIMNLVYFFLSEMVGYSNRTTELGHVLCGLLSLSLFAYLSDKGVMTAKYFSVVGVVFIIVSILYYYKFRATNQARFDMDETGDVTNNATAVFAFIIPMLFYIKNNLQKWLMLSICVFYLIAGAKRGNIVAAVIPIVLFVGYSLKDARRSPMKVLFILIAIATISILAYGWFVSNDFVMHRLDETMEGDTSNRDVIYPMLWNFWLNSDNLGRYLLGYGYMGTQWQLHKFAHCDWLEILVDYGLLGIILYLAVFISFIVLVRRVKNTQGKLVLVSVLSIWFVKSLVSMGFLNINLPLLMVCLGTVVGAKPNYETT